MKRCGIPVWTISLSSLVFPASHHGQVYAEEGNARLSPFESKNVFLPKQKTDGPGATQPTTVRPALMPQIDPTDGHRFVMGGEPWCPFGYYPKLSSLTAQAQGGNLREYYQALHEKLFAHGLNYYCAVFNEGLPVPADSVQTLVYERSHVPGAADGGNKFDLDAFNEAHFRFWRDLLEDARIKGIVVQVCLLDSWHVKEFKSKPARWNIKYDYYHGTNNINGVDADNADAWHTPDPASPVWRSQLALIDAVVDRLGDLPNIIWEVSNEPRPYYDGSDKSEVGRTPNNWALLTGRHLKEHEQKRWGRTHLCMGVDLPDHQHVAGQRPDWFFTTEVEKDGHTPAGAHRDLVTQFRGMKHPWPLITDNDAGLSQLKPDGRRQKAWAALTAGANMDYFHEDLGDVKRLQGEDIALSMRWIGFVNKFLRDRSINLRGMSPSDELVSSGWCLARPGDEYIVYLTAGGSTKVANLPYQLTASWFNPRTAEWQPAAGGPAFDAPGSEDWVLHIRRTGAASKPASTVGVPEKRTSR